MKYYILGNKILASYKSGAIEIENPIREDGTVLPLHKNLDKTAKQEDGSLYDFYLTIPDANGIYQPDVVKITAKVIEDSIVHFKSLYLEIFNAKLAELDYDSIATVQLWMSDATFGAEATKIMTWYKAIIAKNYEVLTTAKESGVIPTDAEYLAAINSVIF